MFSRPNMNSDPRQVLREFKRGDVLTAEVLNAIILLATREVSGPSVRQHSRGWWVGSRGATEYAPIVPVYAKLISGLPGGQGSQGGLGTHCTWAYDFWPSHLPIGQRNDTTKLNRTPDGQPDLPHQPVRARLPYTEYEHVDPLNEWKRGSAAQYLESADAGPYMRWLLVDVYDERPTMQGCDCPV